MPSFIPVKTIGNTLPFNGMLKKVGNYLHENRA